MAFLTRNEVFSCFVFYAVLLVIKMYILAIITGQVRLRKKVSGYESEERIKKRESNIISSPRNFFLMQSLIFLP